jgi:hypothetical protein
MLGATEVSAGGVVVGASVCSIFGSAVGVAVGICIENGTGIERDCDCDSDCGWDMDDCSVEYDLCDCE